MKWLRLCFCQLAVICVALSACSMSSSEPPAPIYDVRSAVVLGGPGIPAQDRERVVERFVRLEQSRSEPGSGLGLSLASAVAEAHSGKLVLGDGDKSSGRLGLSARLVLPAA